MSLAGRPKSEYRSAKHEGIPASRSPGRLPHLPQRSLGWAGVAVALAGAAVFGLARAQKPVPLPASAPASHAAAPSGGAAWSALTPAQRTALAPLQREWHQMSPDNKQKWLEVAARSSHLPEAERARMQARMAEWARMSPQERSQARLRFQQARKLSAQERHEKWQEYMALPPEQRQHLASSPAAKAEAREKEAPRERPQAKSNTVPIAALPATAKTVSPTVVQAKPGATTNLISRTATPPTHQQPGLAKIAATPGLVDSATLLPRRGSQGAAARTLAPEPLPPIEKP